MSLEGFNPNTAASKDSGIFGLPFSYEESKLVVIPVPWEATTSYGGGTSAGPEAVERASRQVDLYDIDVEKPYTPGICLLDAPPELESWNAEARGKAEKIIEVGGEIGDSPELKAALNRVNELGEKLNQSVYENTRKVLKDHKIPAILGGDHAVPFGAIQAAGEWEKEIGVLHFDAHSDTRKAYEGFEWSHASIMYNVCQKIPQVKKLVQVGIRDFCEEEVDYCKAQGSRINVHFDNHLKTRLYRGETWAVLCEEIVKALPEKVWISFDIDGLDPRLCPGTGTPVPGGLDFSEANFLIGEVVRSGRRIIGFDLNEVSPTPGSEWDANVGARLLYKLCAWTFASQGLCLLRNQH